MAAPARALGTSMLGPQAPARLPEAEPVSFDGVRFSDPMDADRTPTFRKALRYLRKQRMSPECVHELAGQASPPIRISNCTNWRNFDNLVAEEKTRQPPSPNPRSPVISRQLSSVDLSGSQRAQEHTKCQQISAHQQHRRRLWYRSEGSIPHAAARCAVLSRQVATIDLCINNEI